VGWRAGSGWSAAGVNRWIVRVDCVFSPGNASSFLFQRLNDSKQVLMYGCGQIFRSREGVWGIIWGRIP
jgi:hypothetical protein